MRLIDLDELKKRLEEGIYDPYEIPGFLDCCEECQVIDAIPIGFIEERIYNLRNYSPADFLTDLVNDWEGSDGYIWRVNHGQQ